MSFKNKIFCALDFSELEQTVQFTNKIKNHVGGIKIGLEFFCKNGPAGVERLKEFELPIFLDLKLHDIPNTVTKAFRNLMSLSPAYLTVHLNGGKRMIEGLIEYKKKTLPKQTMQQFVNIFQQKLKDVILEKFQYLIII